MNDYKDLEELISQTETNKSAFVDYLLEYVDGDYHCLDGSADNEISAFSTFTHTFKHIYALAILLKLQEKFDNSKFAMSFSDEFKNEIKLECEEFGNILFYIRQSLPSDILYENCVKYKRGNGIISNKWSYLNDILDDHTAIIEKFKCDIVDEYRCHLEGLRYKCEHMILDLRDELDMVRNERDELKIKFEQTKDQLILLQKSLQEHQ